MKHGFRKALLLLLPLSLLAGALLWWFGPWRHDRFDYAAAFEAPPAADAAAATLPLSAIAGGSRDAVRDLLGEPQRCEFAQHSERCHYPVAGVQIVFIDGKADWIGVRLDTDEPFAPQTLRRYGLPIADADEVSETVSVWRGLAGYREVRIIDGGYGESLLFIKVLTP